MHKLLVICGPTAAGKTEHALRLAEQWQIPVLNADSRQIYRDLPIGGSLASANMAMVKTTSRLNPSQEGILGALILRLIYRGAASSEMVEPKAMY